MKTRILTALVGIPLVLVLLFWPGGWPWFFGVAVIAAMALHEYTSELGKRGITVHWIGAAVYIAALLISVAPAGLWREQTLRGISNTLLSWNPQHGLVFPPILLALMLAADIAWNRRAPVKNVGSTLLAIGYIGGLFCFLVLLRFFFYTPLFGLTGSAGVGAADRLGAWLMLVVLLIIWAGDSGAYFVGRAIGKHKCAPAISPNKTWEGVIGGLIASALAGLLMLLILGSFSGSLGGTVSLSSPMPVLAVFSLVFGLVVGGMGQIGDLVESAIKREAGVKDFGSLLPGHGGILDRFDSLLFAAPTAYVLLHIFPFFRH